MNRINFFLLEKKNIIIDRLISKHSFFLSVFLFDSRTQRARKSRFRDRIARRPAARPPAQLSKLFDI